MTVEPPQRRQARDSGASRPGRARPIAPLYDAAFEHDACGIGFVADAGGGKRDAVLPLALGGLAALAHRGAFGADGASSDGAGVSLPLDASVLAVLGLDRTWIEERPGVLQLFLPRTGPGARGGVARRLVANVIRASGLVVIDWRTVPTDPGSLGAAARAARPAFVQVFVHRPPAPGGRGGLLSDAAFEGRLVVLRRRIETAARDAGLGEVVAVPSASCRTIVYKGLVAGSRLGELYADLRAPSIRVPYAMFHQRYATNTQPTWRLAQPFRTIAHNGEINTVRGNRAQVRGRGADQLAASSGVARELIEAGPLLAADGSDSQSLDEALELLVATGWDLGAALLTAMPEALALRRSPHPHVAALRRRTAGFLAPWDGPAAIVFGDGQRVGAIADRNGLRPASFAVTRDGLVAVASEAGAIPLRPEETVRRGRLGPGELFLVEPGRGLILEDAEAKAHLLRRLTIHDAPRPTHGDPAPGDEESSLVAGSPSPTPATTPSDLRFLAGLHAENARLDIRTMALEAHEPLWSMGDDTPTPALGRLDRPIADHLRQAFAQVTNPPIDPERERAVMDLRVELGRRSSLLGGPPRASRTLRLERPFLADLPALLRAFPGPVRRLDATWPAIDGAAGLARALDRLAADAVAAARGRIELLVLSDRGYDADRLPVPSILAAGAVHTALTEAGLRGRADVVVETADVLDVHGAAMALATGATVVVPWLAVELAAELAGGRGAEELDVAGTVGNLLDAFDAGLRKTLARMGISTAASYIGGGLFESIELAADVRDRCFPAAPAWRGRIGLGELAERQLRRRAASRTIAAETPSNKLHDPGFARFRADGETHRYAPAIVSEIQLASGFADVAERANGATDRPVATVVRDLLRLRRPRGRAAVPLGQVEPARSIARRFVVSAMSVGALSPEAHQALTIGIQRAGGAANTGEGGEDPGWYVPGPNGERHDARIKQVASARFGVTATYLARGEQLEIKIAQGSKPGEGGQ
ncbi:MAG TPA: glutamate synthase central domain-containing protein, partial [Candidatus Limnocylindrales bacterium]